MRTCHIARCQIVLVLSLIVGVVCVLLGRETIPLTSPRKELYHQVRQWRDHAVESEIAKRCQNECRIITSFLKDSQDVENSIKHCMQTLASPILYLICFLGLVTLPCHGSVDTCAQDGVIGL